MMKKIVVFLLTLEARMVLIRHRPRVIGITGSVGKTSSKDAVYQVLSEQFHTRKTEKSMNSEIGVPLTIIGEKTGWDSPFEWIKILLRGVRVIFSPTYPKWLVLEVGADHPGDIKNIGKWLHLDIMIGTRMSDVPVHVEFYSNPKEVVREKQYLAEAVKPDGVLVLNFDDKDILSFKDKVGRKTITYGVDERADIRGTHMHVMYEKGIPTGVTFKIEDGENTIPVTIEGTLGDHMIHVVLAGITAGSALGLNLVEMSRAFDGYEPTPGRMRILEGIKGSILIDDTYNSSPVALENALHALHTLETKGRKIAVIGDMRELGEYAQGAHENAGKKASLVADVVFAVGDNSEVVAKAALEGGMDERNVYTHKKAIDAGKDLQHILEEGDVVLLKGSQYVRLEKAVEEIMMDPLNKEKLLVRQEEEWKVR